MDDPAQMEADYQRDKERLRRCATLRDIYAIAWKSGRQDGLTGAEERLAASIEQVRRDQFRAMRAQQALFAYLDTLTKTILTCVPEPPADAKAQAVARARERYDRLLKTTGRAMVGDSRVAMQDLVANVEA